MDEVSKAGYKPPFFLFNGHLQTIYPSFFRRVEPLTSVHERINTPDDDFLDLYWSPQSSSSVVIISHGLEGNAHRPYVLGMASACYREGFDTLRWNFRGCGNELNRQRRFYHSGATDDLDTVVNHCLHKGYENIHLVGFSLGGNLTLKYLGESVSQSAKITKAVALSVPMELHTSCQQISKPFNWIYSNRFLKSLKGKIAAKAKIRSDIPTEGLHSIRTLIDFDDRYTAPMHGYKDAIHYYRECSSLRLVHEIRTPTLIINALNDPFLSEECYPSGLDTHPYVRFESPSKGGHVGFTQFSRNGLYWSEQRTVDFLRSSLND